MTRSDNAPSTPSRHCALLSAASFALLLCSALSAGEARAQDWQRIGPDGGVVYSLEVPDPAGNRAYAIGHGGLFRSDDRGATWALMPSPNQNQGWQNFPLHGFSRSDPDTVVLGREDGLWRSTNGGQTWRELVEDLPDGAQLGRITAVAVDPDNARRIAVFMVAGYEHQGNLSSFSALWLSEDGERPALFAPTVNRDPQCRGIVRNGFDHVSLAAFLSGELYYSHYYTCEINWGSPGLPDYYLLRWNHSMYHWFQVPFPVGTRTTIPGRLVAVDGKLFLSIWGGRVHRVDTDGSSAQVVRNRASTLQVAGDGSLIVGEADGLFRSVDRGESWQRMDDGTSSVPGVAMQTGPAVVFTSPVRWLAAGVDGLFGSANADGPWLPSQRGFTGFPTRTVTIDPGNEQRVWAGSTQSRRVLYRTGDGGSTWQTSDLPAIASMLHSIAIDQATTSDNNRTTLYATGVSCANSNYCPTGTIDPPGVFKSTNSGANWQSISGDLPPFYTFGLRQIALAATAASSLPRLLLTGRHHLTSLVVLSNNGGQNWSSPSGLPNYGDNESFSDAMDIRVAPSDDRRVYLATVSTRFGNSSGAEVQRNGVFRSDDGGATWTHRSHGLPQRPGSNSHGGAIRLAVHPDDPDVLWTITTVDDAEWPNATRYHVYRSDNGGLDWNARSTGLGSEQQLGIAVDPANPDRLYLGGVNGVFHSADGGTSWQRLGSHAIGNVTSLAVGPRYLFAGTDMGVQKILKPGQANEPEPCPTSPTGVIDRRLDPRCSGRLWMPAR